MKKTKIGNVAIEFMTRDNNEIIGYSNFGYLQDVWEEAHKRGLTKGVYNNHPANKFLVVLNALDRDDRFEKFFIKCCGGFHNREARVREFKLKNFVFVELGEQK